MDRSLSELTMKIFDVSLLEKSLQQVRNVLLRTHNGLKILNLKLKSRSLTILPRQFTTREPAACSLLAFAY